MKPTLVEAEFLPGLEPFVVEELRGRLGKLIGPITTHHQDSVAFPYRGELPRLLDLDKVAAVYLVQPFDIPRPKALLGHQNFHQMLDQIERVRALHPPGAFASFRFSAAGRDSSVFRRLREEVEAHTGLRNQPDDADLLLRVRPAALGEAGWEVLIRLSPRPLSTRAWRVCDMPGALNATIASAMAELTHPTPDDRYLNLTCGSGTLLIERLRRGPARRAGGCDLDEGALECARENLAAAGFESRVELFEMDAARLDFPDSSFDAAVADLPWGQLVGSPADNLALYPQVVAEAGRVVRPGGSLVLLTHAVTQFEGLLDGFADKWSLKDVHRVFQGGLHPRIYLFERR
ncbi:MAG: methyltransferase domain-containing protein [Chloroflexota bacterium]